MSATGKVLLKPLAMEIDALRRAEQHLHEARRASMSLEGCAEIEIAIQATQRAQRVELATEHKEER